MIKLSKILTGIAAVIGLIGLYFFVRILVEGDDVIKSDPDVQASTISPFITFSLWVLYITIVSTVVFSLISITKKIHILKKTVLSLLILGTVLCISYMFASDAEVTDTFGNVLKDGEAGSVSKWVGAGIIYSLVLGAIGLALFIFDLLKGLVK